MANRHDDRAPEGPASQADATRLRHLPCYPNAQAEHLLDWFHLTMRINVMANMAKSLQPPPLDPQRPGKPRADLAG